MTTLGWVDHSLLSNKPSVRLDPLILLYTLTTWMMIVHSIYLRCNLACVPQLLVANLRLMICRKQGNL